MITKMLLIKLFLLSGSRNSKNLEVIVFTKFTDWSKVRTKLILIISLIFFAVCYFLLQQNSYRYKALNYMKEFDTKQTYKYIGKSDEDCKMLQGCKVEVYLEGEITGEDVTVLFLNGRLAQFARAQITK